MTTNTSSFHRRAPISSSLRILFCLGLALVGYAKSHAQVLLNIDYSNLSAVKFTATGNNVATSYSGTLDDGLDLLNFFVSSVYVKDFVQPGPVSTYVTSSNGGAGLTDGIYGNKFEDLAAWDAANPSHWNGYGNPTTFPAMDLTFWTYGGQNFGFDATHTFQGEAVFDLSSFPSYTSLFPALYATGDIVGHASSTVLGQWRVVAVAVPEPSTYAVIFGAAALVGTSVLRRRIRRQSI